jgi:hypothetical protein
MISGGAAAAAVAEPSVASTAPPEAGSVAAASGTRTNPFSPKELSKRATDPLVIAILAAAVVLLGVASLPVHGIANVRMTQVLARRRLEIASVGLTALIAALIALGLG